MKTKLFNLMLVCILMGILYPAFASSPDKNKGDKTKVEKLTLPPPTWTLHIHVMDTANQCSALNCTGLVFLIQKSSNHCIALTTDPPIIVSYYPGTVDYYPSIPDDWPCVIVSIIDQGGSCGPINSNTCCECKVNNNVCKLYICP
jgi:hypothetical protein